MNYYETPAENVPAGWGENNAGKRHQAEPRIAPGFTAMLERMLQFESIITLLPTLPGDVELELDKVATMAMLALGIIKNRYTVRWAVELDLDENAQADLPDNCQKIDCVLGGASAVSRITVATSLDDLTIAASQLPVYGRSTRVGFADQPIPKWGKPLDCTIVHGPGALRLQMSSEVRGTVMVVYRSRLSDARGWPLITQAEALAIAWYCVWIETGKRFFRKEVSRDMLSAAAESWEQSLSMARLEGMGDVNGFRRMMDERLSSHRHSYGSDVRIL